MATYWYDPGGTISVTSDEGGVYTDPTWESWTDTSAAGVVWLDGQEAGNFEFKPVEPQQVPQEWAIPNPDPVGDLQRQEKKALKKAKRLLKELIGKTDYNKFCKSGYVDVEGKSGRVYRIKGEGHIEVFGGKDNLDVAIDSLCIVTNDELVPEDNVVWRKLLVEADEAMLLEVANHHGV